MLDPRLSQLIVWMFSDGRFVPRDWNEFGIGRFRRGHSKDPPIMRMLSFYLGSPNFMVERYLLPVLGLRLYRRPPSRLLATE